MKRLKTNKWMTFSLMICGICLLSSGSTGYEDIDECTSDPCPDGYECLNLPNGYMCIDPQTGDGFKYVAHYEKTTHDCKVQTTIGADGYVTILGKRFYVGGEVGSDYTHTFFDVDVRCSMVGNELCSPVTCADFWNNLDNI